ncbi:MAG: 8-oxoguanine DNA glycosylase [Verrucomicrobiae bacterium]|nr:8-oxoguanine DNA glycosylase [Verrucomicrobiae bacterium]
MSSGRRWVREFRVRDYDLGATLDSGQAFRWVFRDGAWEGVVGGRWVRLSSGEGVIRAESGVDPGNWEWLREYLRVSVDLEAVLATFPPDAVLAEAVRSCRGLRLLRQDPWECLASFLMSSTKQIPQIRQVVGLLCERWGKPVRGSEGGPMFHAFPEAGVLAKVSESELRECRMGFRAASLRAAAGAVASGNLDLEGLKALSLNEARARLEGLPGVGRKIADCVLLFAGGFDAAFPVDVWVRRALGEWYFPGRTVRAAEIMALAEGHFGPYGGWAQQYLFHGIRKRAGRVAPVAGLV